VERGLRSNASITVFQGHARFASPRDVEIDGAWLHAPRIFINVGGRALIPQMLGLDRIDYLTNSSILDLDIVPPHLVIVGGSYIGLEFAQIY
ncbi:FAD-dependent oxidoreductase, partial [Escherichia coli]|uniref:FAD-dependent oxidoreductase n=1 Tax=Escherichia coli TaxID=562 RepID=UPI0027391DC9